MARYKIIKKIKGQPRFGPTKIGPDPQHVSRRMVPERNQKQTESRDTVPLKPPGNIWNGALGGPACGPGEET